MNTAPEISVVIPVYNVERFLHQCINSVLAQTFQNFEIICVNDGSTDGSLDILKEYQKKDNRIYIISQENQGLSSARNMGLKYSHGKYISFLDSDDFMHPDMLDMLHTKAELTQAEITICNFKLFFNDTKTYGYYRDEIFYYHMKFKIFDLRSEGQIVNCIAAWDRLIRKSFLEKYNIKFIPGIIYEDVPFHIDCIVNASSIVIVPDHLLFYRKNAGGSITDNESKNKKCRHDFIFTRRYAKEKLKKYGSNEDIWYFYAIHFISQAIMHFKNCKMTKEQKLFFIDLCSCVDNKMYNITKRILDTQSRNFLLALKNNDYTKACEVIA
ncbi:glycosyltransferase [uncultured Mailhella sp.]|uniref:glycosyltransferase family 2 protein n=1 Tax=uncultured Mailhella sp. TaxID=1981031 RepID=UPI0025D6B321|nr:glycosyltransferase [uncultured Mailhella sp.]